MAVPRSPEQGKWTIAVRVYGCAGTTVQNKDEVVKYRITVGGINITTQHVHSRIRHSKPQTKTRSCRFSCEHTVCYVLPTLRNIQHRPNRGQLKGSILSARGTFVLTLSSYHTKSGRTAIFAKLPCPRLHETANKSRGQVRSSTRGWVDFRTNQGCEHLSCETSTR